MEITEKKQRQNRNLFIGCLSPFILAFIIFVYFLFSEPSKGYEQADIEATMAELDISEDSAKVILSAKYQREQNISKQFSAYDNSHNRLKDYVKSNLKDPESFKHEGTQYWDKGDHLIILMKYRAKNSFGGYVVGNVKAKSSIDGTELEILSSD